MIQHSADFSPQGYARTGGWLYLVIIVLGLFGEGFARNSLIVAGDATATANAIMASEWLWRASIAGNLFHLMCAVALAMIFYVLLSPVNRNLALLAAFFNLVSIAIEAGSKFFLFGVGFLLGDVEYLKAFDPEQLHGLAYVLIRADGYGFGISLVFFGGFCVLIGYLIFKSGYLPRTLGALLQLAGACYLINSFAMFLSPPVASTLFPWILLPPLVAEVSICLWLIVKGVNLPRWEQQISS